MTDDPVIDRSEAQKAARVEQLRAELAELGYDLVRKENWNSFGKPSGGGTMRLVDLDPRWLIQNGRRVGFTFFSPVQSQGMGKSRWRQSCFIEPTSSDVQFDLLGDEPVQHCNPACAWKIEGGIENASFETMTVTPSIDGSAGGLWHGFITNGEIR